MTAARRHSVFLHAARVFAVLLAAVPAAAEQVIRIPIAANDLAYDPTRGRLYASVGSGAGANANSIAVIDASTGEVLSYIPVGSTPSRLAVSDDGRYLYAGLGPVGAVMQVDLQAGTAGLQFTLPARTLTVAPQRPSNWRCSPVAPARSLSFVAAHLTRLTSHSTTLG